MLDRRVEMLTAQIKRFVRCRSKQAKHELAEEYRQTTTAQEELFLILEGRARRHSRGAQKNSLPL